MENNTPQTGEELRQLLLTEGNTPTRESKVVIGSQTKQQQLQNTTNKQISVSNASTNKQIKLKQETDPTVPVNTDLVSYVDFAKSFPEGTSLIDIDVEYLRNQRATNERKQAEINQNYERKRDRSVSEIASDTGLSLAKNASLIGEAALGFADLAGSGATDNFGNKLNRAMGAVLGKDTAIPKAEDLDKQMSTKVQAQQKNIQDRVAAVKRANETATAALGDKATWWDTASSVGSELSENLVALVDNPSALADVALSSALAFTVPAAVSKGLTKAAIKNAKPEDIAELIASGKLDKLGEAGAVIGTAGLEGFSQAYSEKEKVLETDPSALRETSPKFRELEDKYGTDKAKQMIADSVFQSNLGLTAVLAGVASKVTGAAKLEKDLFVGSDTLTAIGKEALEESLQSASSNTVANLTEKTYVDKNQTLTENLGSAVATGLAGAVVSTAALSGTANAGSVLADKVDKGLAKVQDQATKLANAQQINTEVMEAATTGNFDKLTSNTNFSMEEKINMLLSDDVIGKVPVEQQAKIAEFAGNYYASLEAEDKDKLSTEQQELSQTTELVKNKIVKDQIDPIIGDLENIDDEKEGTIVRALGSSPNSFTQDQLIQLAPVVSESTRSIVDAQIEANKAIEEVEAIPRKATQQVNQDVIKGGKGFLGLNDYRRRFEAAIGTGNVEAATKAADMLANLATLQAGKAADMTALMKLHNSEGNSQRYQEATKNYQTKYNLKPTDSIHRGSDKSGMVSLVVSEAKALNKAHKVMAAVLGHQSGKPVQALKAPKATVIPEAVKEPVAVAKPQPGIPMGEPKEASVATPVPAPVEEAKPVASSEAATATEAKADETTEPVKKELSEAEEYADSFSNETKPEKPTTPPIHISMKEREDRQREVNKKKKRLQKKLEQKEEALKKAEERKNEIRDLVNKDVVQPVNEAIKATGNYGNKTKLRDSLVKFGNDVFTALKTKGIAEARKRVGNYARGAKDALNRTVDMIETDSDYVAGANAVKKVFAFKANKSIITNKIYDNGIARFFNTVDKNTLFNTTGNLIEAIQERSDEFGVQSNSSQEVLDNFVDFHKKFKASVEKLFKAPYTEKAMVVNNNFMGYFTNAEGKLDDAMVTAMAGVAYNYMTESASDLIDNDDDAIRNILNMEDEEEVSPQIRNAMRYVGITLNVVAESMGDQLVSSIGLKYKTNISEAEEATMSASLGTFIVSMLEDAGLMKLTSYGRDAYLEMGFDEATIDKFLPEKLSGYLQVHYIRPVTQMWTATDEATGKSFEYEDLIESVVKSKDLLRAEKDDPDNMIEGFKPVINNIFDIEPLDKEPLLVQPKEQGKKVKRSRQSQSVKQNQAINKMSQEPWQLADTFESYNKLSVEAKQAIAGFATEEEIAHAHVSKRETMAANNKSITRVIKKFDDFVKNADGKDFYLPVEVWKNLRMGYKSSTINPQTNKMIRRLIGLKNGNKTVDLTNDAHIKTFRMALMEAFDIKLKWENIQNDDALNAKLTIPEVKAAVDMLVAGNMSEQVLVNAVKKLGTNYHAYHGLIAYAKSVNNKVFETDLLFESDGVANGVAISLWQFAGARTKEQFKQAMQRTGVYENNEYGSYLEYQAQQGNMDSYQVLASRWGAAVNELKGYISKSDIEYTTLFAKFKTEKGTAKKLGYLINFFGSNEKALEGVNAITSLVGDLTNTLGEVEKLGRDMAKSPTMTSIYNAGLDSILDKVSDGIIERMYDQLENDVNKGTNNKERIVKALNVLFNANFDMDSPLEWQLSNIKDKYTITTMEGKQIKVTAEEGLKHVIAMVYGPTLDNAMYSVYGRLLDNRQTANQAITYAFRVFKEIYDIEEKNKLAELGVSSLSKDQRDELINQLKPYWPVLATPTSKDNSEGILLFKEKKRKGYKTDAKAKAFAVVQEYAGKIGSNGNKQRTVNASAIALEEPGASGIPTAVQMLDAHTMFGALSEVVGLNVHDAIGSTIADADNNTTAINKAYNQMVMGNYNIETSVELMLDNAIKAAQAYGIEDKLNRMTDRYDQTLNPTEVKDQIELNIEMSNKLRSSLKVSTISQYDKPNGAYLTGNSVIDTDEVVVEEVVQDVFKEMKDLLGSQDVTKGTEDFSQAQTYNATVDNSMDIFNQLETLGSVEDNTEHKEHLRSVLSEMINKVLQPTLVVLGTVDEATRGRFMQDVNGKRQIEIATSVGDFEYGLSAQEVYVHEMIHNIIGHALSSGAVEVKRITAMFNAVKDLVDSGDITYKDFLSLDQAGNTISNPTQEQIDDATDRLNYIFNNTTVRVRKITDPATGIVTTTKTNSALEEFVAFGTTNAAFMKALNKPNVLMALKTKLRPEHSKTKSNTWLIQKFDSIVNALLDMIQFAMDKLTDRVLNIAGKKVDAQLATLVSALAGVQVKHQSKVMQGIDAVLAFSTASTAKLKAWVVAPIVAAANSSRFKNSKNTVVRVTTKAIAVAGNSKAGTWAKALRQTRSRLNMTQDNFALSLAQEIAGVTSKNKHWHKLLRLSNKHIDQLRKHVATTVKNTLNEQYSYTLNKEEKAAITKAVLKTDLTALLEYGYTYDEIYDLLKDESKLTKVIEDKQALIKKTYTQGVGRWVLDQSTGLSNKMITGTEIRGNQGLNAYQIANGFGNPIIKKRMQDNKVDNNQLEKDVDELVTLMALNLVDSKVKANVVSIFDKEVASGKTLNNNGLSFTMEHHRNYKVDSRNENFDGNPALMRKGYVKEITDPNIAVQVVDVTDFVKIAELVKAGYKPTQQYIYGDVRDPNGSKMEIYRNTAAKLATNSAGIVSLTSKQSMGTDILDGFVNKDTMSTNIGLDAYLNIQAINKDMEIASNVGMTASGNTKTVLLTPVFNLDGDVVNYRYEMSDANKEKLLKRHNSFDDILSGMTAQIKDKANTKTINSVVVETLKQEFDAEFVKSPKEFVLVGINSTDPAMKELWFTLPEEMRIEATKLFGTKGLYVKKKDLRLIFGFRKFTVGEWAEKLQEQSKVQNKMLNYAARHVLELLQKPLVHQGEEVWQEIVRMAKDTIVVKTGATLVGNVISNFAVLMTEGVSFSDILKYHSIAWKGANKYQKDKNKLDSLKLELENKNNLSVTEAAKMKREIALLENSISTNPVYSLVQEGIYQTIVEDVDMDEDTFSYQSKLEKVTYPLTSKIPDVIKDMSKILFVTHDTQLYKAMRNATQISDFVARFTLHQHNLTKQKMSEEDSINNIVETFVNYDLPTHKSIQYLNDMGLVMFSKFFIRIQKVILRQLTERTGNVLSLFLVQQILGINIADIFDGAVVMPNTIEAKFADPLDHVDTLFGIHLFNNI